MFLQRIEIQGFKSFADKVNIDFENQITGVVGPNGCGKSNIIDAIRWVLGEQSVKSLRGSSMNDVIFAGSADRNKVNVAEVTLVFDNTNHPLNSNDETIEVTRRLYRESGESEYLINRKNVRLKDIIDLILDSGIGKDSLSMISQGNIVQFADAKPIDRRAIFEEAAGVAKYKKRKIETLAKLSRTKDNIERSSDTVNELQSRLGPLKRAAAKAEQYKQKKDRLQEIEVAVLVNDITQLNKSIQAYKEQLNDIETHVALSKANMNINETNNQASKKEINELDKKIESLQAQLMTCLDNISIINQRKVELDQKRKNIIEHGDNAAKIEQLKSLYAQYKNEYEDREKRYNSLNAQLEAINVSLNDIVNQSTQLTNQRFDYQANVNRLQSRHDILENIVKEPFNNQSGVKSIMSHQQSLNGVYGVVGQVIIPDAGYEEAISIALGGALYNIVTKDEYCASKAIDFLKRNMSGRATFLPLTVLKNHPLPREHELIAQSIKGYLGTASDFVSCEETYDPVVASLLNNVIVVDNLDSGNEIAKLLQYNYKIVDLDGDVIHKGGSMSGGKIKNNTSIMSAKAQLDAINNDLLAANANLKLCQNKLDELMLQKNRNESNAMILKLDIAKLEPVLAAKKANFLKVKDELNAINVDQDEDIDSDDVVNEIIDELNQAYALKDQLNSAIQAARNSRMTLSGESERKDSSIRQLRKDLDQYNSQANNIKIEMARLETRLDNNINRLASEYAMTYEYAKENTNIELDANASSEVIQLRSEIEALGNVNMNAPLEYKALNERYTVLSSQIKDLLKARDMILNAIDELDEVMIDKFKTMFDAINKELNEIFKVLFGGGKARLILEDSNDILNTGIDIDIQPPGKAVQNIRLFSGGEKSLIAICVLFAILKVKPVPLVIFDEVEAALDQANVERFAKFLNNFVNQTQFIVVTHRPGTMEQCDVLYGVTMQKQGVSQMLRVELKQAIDMADEDRKDL